MNRVFKIILHSEPHFLYIIWLFAILIRLCFLFVLPILSESITCGEYAKQISVSKPQGIKHIFRVLNNRVQLLPLTEDERRYHEMAENILKGKGICVDHNWFTVKAGEPTAHGACLYPIFLAIIYTLFHHHQIAVWIVQILLNSAIVFPIFYLTKRLFNMKVAILACIISSIYPTLIYNSVWMMREAIAIPLLLFMLRVVYLAMSQGKWQCYILAGGLMGALSLTISVAFYFLPFLFAGVVVYLINKANLKFKYISGMAVSAIIVMMPWLIRNFLIFHEPLLIETKKGVNMWMYNHPGQPISWNLEEHPMPIFDFPDSMNEAQKDKAYLLAALNYIRENKLHFLKISCIRFLLAFSPVSTKLNNRAGIIVQAIISGTLLLFAILGVIFSLSRWKEHILVYLVVIYWILIQTFCVSGMRYRLPMEFAFILYGSAGILQSFFKRMSNIKNEEYNVS